MAGLTQPLKKLKKKFIEKNPLEVIDDPTGIVKGVGKSLREDLVGKDSVHEMWKQILATEEHHGGHHSGDMHEGQEVDLTALHKQEAAKMHDAEPGINYRRDILHSSERGASQENREIHHTVQEIQAEIQRLIDSADTVIRAEFQEIAVEQTPVEAGKYHVSFFEWMLIVIRNARMKVEDSGAWLAAMQSKKGKKNGGMLLNAQRKGNTSVSMSNERSVATQSG